jgi:hypothetical protein
MSKSSVSWGHVLRRPLASLTEAPAIAHLDSTRCERYHQFHLVACMSLCPTACSRLEVHVVLFGTSESTGTRHDLSLLCCFLRCTVVSQQRQGRSAFSGLSFDNACFFRCLHPQDSLAALQLLTSSGWRLWLEQPNGTTSNGSRSVHVANPDKDKVSPFVQSP